MPADAADDAPDPEDLPSTGIEVEAHVHFAMTGSFPLRLAEVFLADDGVYIAEYAYITPFFGLGAGKHRREAAAVRALYDRYGIDEILLRADAVNWLHYDAVSRIALFDGGWLGRAKIAVYADGASYAYRLHDDAPFEEIAADVEAAGERHGIAVERRQGLGFTPRENVRRFFRP